MTASGSYVTLQQFKAAIDIANTDTVDDAELQRALDAATEWIDYYCGRTFYDTATSAAPKLFFAREINYLEIPDVQTVAAVDIDIDGDSTFTEHLAAKDYQLLPLEPIRGGFTEVVIRASSPSAFVVGYQVRVTGFWGYGSTPAAVQQACILVANRYFHRPSAPFSVWEAPVTGQIADVREADADVAALLGPFVGANGAGRSAAAAWVLV